VLAEVEGWVGNLRALTADTQLFSLNLRNKITFCFPIKKTFHNRFFYISLYQLNTIFFILILLFFLLSYFLSYLSLYNSLGSYIAT